MNVNISVMILMQMAYGRYVGLQDNFADRPAVTNNL